MGFVDLVDLVLVGSNRQDKVSPEIVKITFVQSTRKPVPKDILEKLKQARFEWYPGAPLFLIRCNDTCDVLYPYLRHT